MVLNRLLALHPFVSRLSRHTVVEALKYWLCILKKFTDDPGRASTAEIKSSSYSERNTLYIIKMISSMGF